VRGKASIIGAQTVSSSPAYDAILVDEGQDFSPLWWSALRNICKDGGEMLLAADVTLDVFGTATKWTDEAMHGADFRGVWSELPTSYRIPPEIFELVTEFAEKVLPEDIRLIPQAPEHQMELGLSPCFLKWVQVDRNNSVDVCVNELLEIIQKDEGFSRAM
jgi:superfamily I DNA/RNA helicase